MKNKEIQIKKGKYTLCTDDEGKEYICTYNSKYNIGIKLYFGDKDINNMTDNIKDMLGKQYIQRVLNYNI